MRSGEVLSPGSQAELSRLGLPVMSADWRLLSFAMLRLHWPNGRITHDRLPTGVEFWQIDRGKFDRAMIALARASGVGVVQGCRVRDVSRDPSGAARGVLARSDGASNREWRAPVVVDASGRYSPLLARLKLKRPEPAFRRVALVTFYEDMPDSLPGVWEQHFFSHYRTAVKGSLLADRLYRCSLETDLAHRECAQAKHGKLPPTAMVMAMLRDLQPELFHRFQSARPLAYSRAYVPIGYRVASIIHDGLVMVGDSAGYLDPSTGQGIEFALRMARVAAATIDAALRDRRCDRTSFGPYPEGRRREMSAAMTWLRFYLRASGNDQMLILCSRISPMRSAIVRALATPR
jgi:flavin-dependent dehydrogenase